MGYDDLDDEVLFGSFRGNIVGIRYYFGIVSFLFEWILLFYIVIIVFNVEKKFKNIVLWKFLIINCEINYYYNIFILVKSG